jgi:hypothetical protein
VLLPLRPVTTPIKSRYRYETASGTIFINFVDPTGRAPRTISAVSVSDRGAIIDDSSGPSYVDANTLAMMMNMSDSRTGPTVNIIDSVDNVGQFNDRYPDGFSGGQRSQLDVNIYDVQLTESSPFSGTGYTAGFNSMNTSVGVTVNVEGYVSPLGGTIGSAVNLNVGWFGYDGPGASVTVTETNGNPSNLGAYGNVGFNGVWISNADGINSYNSINENYGFNVDLQPFAAAPDLAFGIDSGNNSDFTTRSLSIVPPLPFALSYGAGATRFHSNAETIWSWPGATGSQGSLGSLWGDTSSDAAQTVGDPTGKHVKP